MRQLVLAAAAILAVATTAAAPAPEKSVPEKSVPTSKAFPYLENYLKLPAAERSRFTMGYFLSIGGKPATNVKIWLVDGGKRTPVPLGAEGQLLRTPNLGELERNASVVIEAPPTTKFGLQLQMEPLVPRGTEMDAQALALSTQQADAAVKKAAGVLGFAAPHMTRVYFKDSAGGEAVFADGHSVKLAVFKGFAFYDLDKLRGAKTLRFTKAPTLSMIGPAN
jgi:hypothetical protein